VYSEVGRGATFHVFLPVAAPPPGRAVAEEAVSSLPRGTELVLLVEDRAEVRAVGARMLRAAGYQVLEAGDADEALQLLESGESEVRVLLTDVVLPGTGGELLAATVRRLVPGVRVIFASGYPQDSALATNLSPADAFIQKPLTAAQLLPLMRRVIDG
jgi:CheY-like chemotaxis protein